MDEADNFVTVCADGLATEYDDTDVLVCAPDVVSVVCGGLAEPRCVGALLWTPLL